MSNPFHEIPEPKSSVAGRNNRAISKNFAKIVSLWRPKGAREAGISTIARFAHRLMGSDGRAFTADELAPLATDALTRSAANGNPNGVQAVSYLDLYPTYTAGNFVDGDLISIGVNSYTVLSGGYLQGDVTLGADFAETLASLLEQLAIHPDVDASYGGSANLTVTAKTAGSASNSIAVSATLAAGGGWAESTLSGGTDAISPSFIGQLCRVGDYPPYDWYRADTLSSWIPIVIAGAPVSWNADQSAYQALVVSGLSGSETVTPTNI